MLTWEQFEQVEMRVGTVLEVRDFPEARNPSYQLWIDFGDFGIKKSSAQITHFYQKDTLVGQQVIAVLNFQPKQIATSFSECLVLGLVGEAKEITLLQPERLVPNGQRVA